MNRSVRVGEVLEESEISIPDDCGICSGGESNHVANSDKDCAGDCFGAAVKDNCDVCDLDASNDCIQDCGNQWGGSRVLDDCCRCKYNYSFIYIRKS